MLGKDKRQRNREAVARYRAKQLRENPEEYVLKLRAARKRRYDANPEKTLQASRTSYAKNIVRAREYAKQYGCEHSEERAVRAAAWRKANPERSAELRQRALARRKDRWIEFLEQERQRYRQAYKTDPGKYNAKGAKRRAAKLRATPSWCDFDAIADIYREAQIRTVETGIPHDVDHIIPLRGRHVCGLHIPVNLQIIPSSANRHKFNLVPASESLSEQPRHRRRPKLQLSLPLAVVAPTQT